MRFENLIKEAESSDFARWRTMLKHLACLHDSSMYEDPNGEVPYPLETLGPGYYFSPAFGHWDLIYTLLDSCPVMPEHTLQQLENLFYFQKDDGFMSGAIFFRLKENGKVEPYSYSTFPAVWPLAVDEYTRVTGTLKAVEVAYEPLLKQIGFIEKNRRADEYGFFYYDTVEPRSWESGVDESIRCELVSERGQFPCIDATCHARMLYDAAARYSEMLGKDGSIFSAERDKLDKLVQERFFCDETGFFHDGYLLDRNIKFRTLTGIWALTCGCATEEQANRVIDGSLLNPEYFFTEHPLPYVAINEPHFKLKMWRGGAFNSKTCMAILGCLRYGRKDAALKIAERALDWTQAQYDRTGCIWEFYHPHGGNQNLMARKASPWLLPCREYIGHNPMFVLARLMRDK